MHYRETALWQRAIDISGEVYRLAHQLPREEAYGMRSQITRSAVSIAANIAEGWARESRKEKGWFFSVAHGSLAETETLTTISELNGWFSVSDTRRLRDLLDETSRMLTVMRRRCRVARVKKE